MSGPGRGKAAMTYEAYLDEVTTLITEKYDIDDAGAIALVVKAQDAGFFSDHDDKASMRTLDRAHQDARTLYQNAKKKI